jgi:hypothetical protein
MGGATMGVGGWTLNEDPSICRFGGKEKKTQK